LIFKLRWQSRSAEADPARKAKKASKTKYTCPTCGIVDPQATASNWTDRRTEEHPWVETCQSGGWDMPMVG
jgi:hypothetical protein